MHMYIHMCVGRPEAHPAAEVEEGHAARPRDGNNHVV